MNPESGAGGFDETRLDNAALRQPDGTKLFRKTQLVPAGARFKTVLEAVEYRPISSILPLFTGTTVAKATVRIRYPKDLLDIQVSTGNSTNFVPEVTLWGAEWEIPVALLPGQCIVATWNPKASSDAGAKAHQLPIPAIPTTIEPQPAPITSN